MQYSLDLYSAIYQLYLNTTRRKDNYRKQEKINFKKPINVQDVFWSAHDTLNLKKDGGS